MTGDAAATLKMVAAAAGVSKSTVSRVINDSPNVTPEAVAAVSAAIKELGYSPNRAARSLVSRRTNNLALVIPETTAKFFSDPYFASVIQGAAMCVSETEFTLSLLIATEHDLGKSRRFLRSGSADGAAVLSHHSDDTSYADLVGTLPLVFGGRPMSAEGDRAYYVDVDNVAVGRQITDRLIVAGRRRIATIGGPTNMAAGPDRLTGWRLALEAVGQPTDLVELADFTPAGGAAAAQRLVDRGVAFDGLFVASAQMAMGALGVLREHGLRVPADVGLVTVDNDAFAQAADPQLTTVEQPTLAVGRTMIEILLARIAGERVERVTMLPTTIIDRGSQ